MSQNKDFVEKEDKEFSTQLKTFSDGVNSATAPNGATVGLSTGEIAAAKKDADYFKYALDQQDKAKGFSQSFTKYKNDLRKGSDVAIVEPVFDMPATVPPAVDAGVEDRFRKVVAKVKKSGSYTKGMGEAWHIEAPEFTEELGIPQFTVELAAGHPLLKWPKKTADAIQIWKDDGTGFRFLDRDMKSPFVDKEDLPAAGQSKIWKYKIIYIINDEPVGDYSAVIEVTVKGI